MLLKGCHSHDIRHRVVVAALGGEHLTRLWPKAWRIFLDLRCSDIAGHTLCFKVVTVAMALQTLPHSDEIANHTMCFPRVVAIAMALQTALRAFTGLSQ